MQLQQPTFIVTTVFTPSIAAWRQSHELVHWWGYVDDCGSVLHGTRAAAEDIAAQLKAVDHRQFVWEVQISDAQLIFLDLDIPRTDLGFSTRSYQKPGHLPQLLHACSGHPDSMKKHIFAGSAFGI